MAMLYIMLGVIYGVIFGYATQHVAKEKGKDPESWFWIGFFLGLIGLLMAMGSNTETPQPKNEGSMYGGLIESSKENEIIIESNSNMTESETEAEIYFLSNCPVAMRFYQMLKDSSKEIFLSCELKNFTNKTISAVIMDIKCFGIDDAPFTSVEGQAYLDLNVKPLNYFGMDEMVKIPDKRSRKFEFVIKKVLFDDESWWVNEANQPLEIWSAQLEPISILGEYESQYLRELNGEIGEVCAGYHKTLIYKSGEIMVCGCGEIIPASAELCPNCKIGIQMLGKIKSLEYLEEKQKEHRFEVEKQNKIKLEEEKCKREEEKLKEKRKKEVVKIACRGIIIITTIIVLTAIGFFFVKPEIEYRQGVEFFNSGEYGDAKAKFEQLGDYKDSEKYNEYSKATIQFESQNYYPASSKFKKLGNFMNSQEMFIESNYQRAKYLIDKHENKFKIETAAKLLIKLEDYKDSQQLLKKLLKDNPEVADSLK